MAGLDNQDKIALRFPSAITSVRCDTVFRDPKTGVGQIRKVRLETARPVQAAPAWVGDGDNMVTCSRLRQNGNLAVFCVSHWKITLLP